MEGEDTDQTKHKAGHGDLSVCQAENCGEDITGKAVTGKEKARLLIRGRDNLNSTT